MEFQTFSITGFLIVPILIVVFAAMFISKQYKRCPSNKILVIFGNVGGNGSAKCIHGGGAFVIPLLQDYTYLTLEPITIEIDLRSALSKKNIRVNVPSTFTVGISTKDNIMTNAAERLFGLGVDEISGQAQDIILGQMRLVIATLAIEEINQDREKFLDLVNTNVNLELNKIGLDVINVNIRDITDESGYIEAIGKKAAAEAINKARVEVAEQEKDGAIGEASAVREKQVMVAQQVAHSETGQKEAERNRRIAVSKFEAEGVAGEAEAKRMQVVAEAKESAKAEQGIKEALTEQRVFIANQDAESVKGENEAKANIASYEANLNEKKADAKRRGEVALARAQTDVFEAKKLERIAELEKEEIAQEEINKSKVVIRAEAEAEHKRRIARGEADAILAKYEAEAEGVRKVLEAKAQGYRSLLETVGENKSLAPTLLVVEQLPELIAQQVKAIQNLKIDKVTVLDGGQGDGKSSTSGFLRSLIGSLPPIHDLAKQAGVELPEFFGELKDSYKLDSPANNDGETPPLV